MPPSAVLIGAVHEAHAAFDVLANHPDVELRCVVTLSPSAAVGVSGFVDLSALAERSGIDSLRVDDANASESLDVIRKYEPSLMVVVGWTRLISPELLSVPTHGCVGFHASMLPRNRGRAPINWAIIRGETSTGNTMMYLSPGVDTGDIVDQRSTPIYLGDTCATVYGRIAELGADMLREHLPSLVAGVAPRSPQSDRDATYLPKRVPDMGVIDWRRPPVDVYNWIRAQTAPYPGAFTRTEAGGRLMCWESTPPLQRAPAGCPGEVISIDDDGLRLGAGGGSVLVTQASWPGEVPEPAGEWAARNRIDVGQRMQLPSEEESAWSRGQGPRPQRNPS